MSKNVKLHKINVRSRLLRGAVRCHTGKYLPVSGGNLLVPFEGTAAYVRLNGERLPCKTPGSYFVRSIFNHHKNERSIFLDVSRANEGQDVGVNITTHYKINVQE